MVAVGAVVSLEGCTVTVAALGTALAALSGAGSRLALQAITVPERLEWGGGARDANGER